MRTKTNSQPVEPGGSLGSLDRPEEARIKRIAVCTAVLIHALVLMLNFPPPRQIAPAPRTHPTAIVVRKYVPPPPPSAQRISTVRKPMTRRMPVPDPTPDLPEPIVEGSPEIALEAIPGDVDVLLGQVGPPPAYAHGGVVESGPFIAGVGGSTLPVRIEESYVQPLYPEMAREARRESEVVIRAVICSDGSVGEAVVLTCTQPGFGFEQAAVDAVTRWRYVPATMDGMPVDVYFTVVVEFCLV